MKEGGALLETVSQNRQFYYYYFAFYLINDKFQSLFVFCISLFFFKFKSL